MGIGADGRIRTCVSRVVNAITHSSSAHERERSERVFRRSNQLSHIGMFPRGRSGNTRCHSSTHIDRALGFLRAIR
jgi:hypothetical protein